MSPLADQDLGFGIHCIDTLQERPGMAASYLVRRGDEAALIEAGTSHSLPLLMAALARQGLRPEQVRYVVVTHVHLDHAGGAGSLMRVLPQATLLVHPRGLRHMTDPSKLIAGASAVYGVQALQRMYGEILPSPTERCRAVADGECLPFGSASWMFLDTPGHARHHLSVWDSVSQGFFTGDTFGLAYREFDDAHGVYLIPTTTPVQFEPDAWRETLARYLSLKPQRMFLTHYGVVEGIAALAQQLAAGIARYEAIGLSLRHLEMRHEAIKNALWAQVDAELTARQHAMPTAEVRRILATDIELNAQGLGIWLDGLPA
jgi:glyoxylase-like metal-dependent hydrolase (beta-lactamase superfamily II)